MKEFVLIGLILAGSGVYAAENDRIEVGRGMMGEALMIRVERMTELDNIGDITIDGVSVLEELFVGLENGGVMEIQSPDRVFFKVTDPALINMFKHGSLDVTTQSTKTGEIENTELPGGWGNPSVEISGKVMECDPSTVYPAPLGDARVEATMNSLSRVDWSHDDGYYRLYWSAGNCESSVRVKATSSRTYKYTHRYAYLSCWGWDSDDQVDFFFANGISICY